MTKKFKCNTTELGQYDDASLFRTKHFVILLLETLQMFLFGNYPTGFASQKCQHRAKLNIKQQFYL